MINCRLGCYRLAEAEGVSPRGQHQAIFHRGLDHLFIFKPFFTIISMLLLFKAGITIFNLIKAHSDMLTLTTAWSLLRTSLGAKIYSV